MQYKRYKKEFDYSYSFGIFPTLELLTHKPETVRRVYVHSKAELSEGAGKIEALCSRHHIPFERNDKAISRLTHKDNIYVFAVFDKFSTQLSAAADHLLLVNPSDNGNLGTIARTMLGFGFLDLALITPATDIFSPHVVRASMGAVFALRHHYYERFGAYSEGRVGSVYPFMLGAQKYLPEVTFARSSTLVFGPEGAGLPDHYAKLGQSVKIPQSELIESFNIAIAASLAMYEVARQRLTSP